MKNLFAITSTSVFLVAVLISSNIKAQLPAGSNGKFITVNNVKLYYEDTGRGVPLLLLHGFGGTTSHWEPYIREFAKNYRVIAMDLPGHGRSDFMDTTEVYLHKRAAEYIIGLLDQLQIDSINIMGISSGGFITTYIATIRPQLVKKMVVIGSQVYYSKTTREVITAVADPAKNQTNQNRIREHGQQKAVVLERQFWNFRKLYGDPSFTPDVLATVTARVLIIHGDNDPIAPVSNAWDMFQHIPKAKLWIVPNGGHVPSAIPANRDDFLRRVGEFLDGKW